MKCANLVLDEKLLEKTVQVSGKKTYSEAMRQHVQKKAFTQIFSLEGSGAWQGFRNDMDFFHRDRVYTAIGNLPTYRNVAFKVCAEAKKITTFFGTSTV